MPVLTIDDICAQAQIKLGQTDPEPVQLTLAAAVSSFTDNEPFWPMIVGPSSIGKTTILTLTKELALTLDRPSLAALITINQQGQLSGILPAMGRLGSIVIPDFSTILGLHPAAKDEVFACLRRVYDGEYTKHLAWGKASWEGKATIIAACTSAIDSFPTYSAELGTRFVYYRINAKSTDEYKSSLRKGRPDKTGILGLQNQVKTLVTAAARKVKTLQLTESFEQALFTYASVTALGRTDVPRQGYTHNIVGEAEAEAPYRVYNQLQELARCLIAMGMTEDQAAVTCAKVARDSMPVTRRNVIQALIGDVESMSVNQLSRLLRANRSVIARCVEDLYLSDLLDELPGAGNDPSKWYISGHHYGAVSSIFNGLS